MLIDQLRALNAEYAKLIADQTCAFGYLVMLMWADPEWELQTLTRWNEPAPEGEFHPLKDDDEIQQAGLLTYEELYEHGVSPGAIRELYQQLLRWQFGAAAEGEEVGESVSARVRSFPLATAA